MTGEAYDVDKLIEEANEWLAEAAVWLGMEQDKSILCNLAARAVDIIRSQQAALKELLSSYSVDAEANDEH